MSKRTAVSCQAYWRWSKGSRCDVRETRCPLWVIRFILALSRCPVCPQQRPNGGHSKTVETCQSRLNAPQQIIPGGCAAARIRMQFEMTATAERSRIDRRRRVREIKRSVRVSLQRSPARQILRRFAVTRHEGVEEND